MAGTTLKPIIGITVESQFQPEIPRSRGKIELNWNYFEEISKAGGVPIVIPPTADMAEVAPLLDGWLLPGGLDIPAKEWGEEDHPEVDTQDGTRFDAERRLYAAISPTLPIFGICYGAQSLNVLRGGSLEQHIPDRSPVEHTGGPLQRYHVVPGSRLADILGTAEFEGQSWHHQAVGRVGRDLRVVAEHEDGTPEAIESTDERWLIGLQCHPERTPGSDATDKVFAAFIAAAREFRARKELHR